MKSTLFRVFLTVLVLTAFLSCSSGKKETLYLYNWSDYIDEDLVKEFTKETGIKVVTDYFDSNESMFAKLKSGAGGYDIVFPTSYMAEIMMKNGMLQELDHDRLSNLGNLDPRFLNLNSDSKMDYSVPYMVSTTGIGYLESVTGEIDSISWDVFGDSRFAGKMTMLNDVRETIGAALKYLGYSYNSTSVKELEEARDLLIKWKKNLAKFENDQYKNGLVSGEFSVSQGYSGDILQVQEEQEDLRFIIPREGTSISIDNMVILKDARNPEAAYAFIDYMLRPEVAAANTAYVWYLAPNLPSYELLDQEILEDPAVFLDDAVIDTSEILLDLGDDNALYSRIWDEIKSAE